MKTLSVQYAEVKQMLHLFSFVQSDIFKAVEFAQHSRETPAVALPLCRAEAYR